MINDLISRKYLKGFLEVLIDVEYQICEWDKSKTNAVSLEDVWDYVFEAKQMDINPERYISEIFFDEEELQTVKIALDRLEKVVDVLGFDLSGSEYNNTPEWNSLVEASRQALRTMIRNE